MSVEQRLYAAITDLENQGVAVTFYLYGSTGVRDWDLKCYQQRGAAAGTDRWVGAMPGSDDAGGVRWINGTLYYKGLDLPVPHVWWSFNHLQRDLPALLVEAFTAHGLTASYDGVDNCVCLDLAGAR